jgi:putative transposase
MPGCTAIYAAVHSILLVAQAFQPVLLFHQKFKMVDFHSTHRNLPHWHLPGSIYFVTFRVYHGELTTKEQCIVLDAIKHFHSKRYWIWASVVMPDHVHLLIRLYHDRLGKEIALGKVLKSIKGYSAREINKGRYSTGKFWQDEYFDRIVRNEVELKEKWNYIRNNPVKKTLSDSPENYSFLWEPGPPS